MRNLIVLALLLSCSLGRGDDSIIAKIPVTHTWGDLMNAKPLIVESDQVIFFDSKGAVSDKTTPISFQIGIDRNRSVSYGNVVLYCLTKSVFPSYPSGQKLGPFRVNVQEVDTQSISFAQDAVEPSALNGSNYYLLARSFSVRTPGKYAVELFLPIKPGSKEQPKLIAKTEVTVSGEPVLPWSPWGSSKKESLRWAHGGNIPGMTSTHTSMTVCNPVGSIAFPMAGTSVGDEIPAAKTPLPQLITDDVDPATQLKLEGNTLVVNLGQELTIYFPDDHFLTRWWINDKPFVPDPKAVDTESRAHQLGAQAGNVKEVHFNLDFRPERLGAQKGDKIEVQVLFCPGGWRTASDTQWAVLMQEAVTQPGPFPTDFSFPSNRIDFIYSGDPENIQQK